MTHLLHRLCPIKLRTPCILIAGAKNEVNDMKLVHYSYLLAKNGMNLRIVSYVYKILKV